MRSGAIVGRMREQRERYRADGSKDCLIWVPAERVGALQTLAECWCREVGLPMTSGLPSAERVRALHRTSKTQLRPVPPEALQSRPAAEAWLSSYSAAGYGRTPNGG